MKDHPDYDSDYVYMSDDDKFVCGCCNSEYNSIEDIHKHWNGEL